MSSTVGNSGALAEIRDNRFWELIWDSGTQKHNLI